MHGYARGEEMARIRSDKSKTKPLHKPEDRKETRKERMKAGQSDEGAPTSAEPTGRVTSENPASLQPAAKPKKRQEQRIRAPSADLRASETLSAQEPFTASASTTNEHPSIGDDPITHRRIAEQAFILFQANGCEHGNDWSHWFEAERQIKESRV